MMVLSCSLVTLLVVSAGLLVSTENVISCYGDVQQLSCESGLINVQSAVYGRTDKSVCATGRSVSELLKTDCSLKTALVSKRCDGQRTCEFKTDVLGDPDPCYGTYKYYNTTYTCVQGCFRVACESGYSTLDCGTNTIQIINANYGRINPTTCSEGRPSSQLNNTNCYAPDTLSSVVSGCNGKTSCTVYASNTIFTDPCVGTTKYLTVSYFCLPPPIQTSVTCEGSNASLSCGSGVLKILSANFGRTDSTTCSSGQLAKQVTKTDCYTAMTLAEVANRCQGRVNCVVPASNDVFTEPCYGTYKYLSIIYSCVMYSFTRQSPRSKLGSRTLL